MYMQTWFRRPGKWVGGVLALALTLGMTLPMQVVGETDGEHGEDDEAIHAESGGPETSHDDHEEHEGERVVALTPEQMAVYGVEVATAGPGSLLHQLSLPGEIAVDPDRLAHIVPRVPGVVRQVYKRLGDRVHAGEVVAVLESRELSELKSAYLIAREELSLAFSTHEREERLWREQVSPEREYLAARQGLAASRIAVQAAEQKLHAVGFSEQEVRELSFDLDEEFTRYAMTAPFGGVIIAKHLVLGEVLDASSEVLTVADLSHVWAMLTVYQRNLGEVQAGQPVHVRAGDRGPDSVGEISYVSPLVEETTRASRALVVLNNADGQWRPGMFVRGEVGIAEYMVAVAVPKSAIQNMGGETVVFVDTDEGFEPRPVRTGRRHGSRVEITGGLRPGERYVARGAFTLKAELGKGSLSDGHGH